jgi:hypothetical protein
MQMIIAIMKKIKRRKTVNGAVDGSFSSVVAGKRIDVNSPKRKVCSLVMIHPPQLWFTISDISARTEHSIVDWQPNLSNATEWLSIASNSSEMAIVLVGRPNRGKYRSTRLASKTNWRTT